MKKPAGSRFLLVKQVKKVIKDAIPRIKTFDEADVLMGHITTMCKSGLLSSAEFDEMALAISDMKNLIAGDHHE